MTSLPDSLHLVLAAAPGEPVWRVPLESDEAGRSRLCVFTAAADALAWWADAGVGQLRVHVVTGAQAARIAVENAADCVVVDPQAPERTIIVATADLGDE